MRGRVMGNSEAKVISQTEEQGSALPLPSPSPSPSSSAAAFVDSPGAELGRMTLEKKPAEAGITIEDTVWGEDVPATGWESDVEPREEHARRERDSAAPRKDGNSEPMRYPRRPGEPDCSFYVSTGSCRFGLNCRFNHPPRRTRNKAKFKKQSEPIQAAKEKEKKSSPEKVRKAEGKKVMKEKQNEPLSERVEHKNCKAGKGKKEKTPSGRMGQTESKAAEGRETPSEREGHAECKYYSVPGGSKSGKAWKQAHFQEKSELAVVELNFLGLPMRLGERECPSYMRTGGCEFATNCLYHHPDPIAVVGEDTLSSQQHASGASALPLTSWPLPITSTEPAPFFDASPSYTPGTFSLPQGFYLNPEWNGYQAPVTPWMPPEMNIMNSSAPDMSRADVTIHQKALVDEYPERPDQPECPYFMKNGDCVFKSACIFHHPKFRLQKCL